MPPLGPRGRRRPKVTAIHAITRNFSLRAQIDQHFVNALREVLGHGPLYQLGADESDLSTEERFLPKSLCDFGKTGADATEESRLAVEFFGLLFWRCRWWLLTAALVLVACCGPR